MFGPQTLHAVSHALPIDLFVYISAHYREAVAQSTMRLIEMRCVVQKNPFLKKDSKQFFQTQRYSIFNTTNK